MITLHLLITGKVQGVYYRDYTRQKAQALQLTGWVKNLADGRVEVMVSGPRAVVMELVEWCWQGSPRSKVSDVYWEEVPQQTFAEFRVC